MSNFKSGSIAKLIETNKAVMIRNSRKEKEELFYTILLFNEGKVEIKEVKESELSNHE